MNLYDEFFSIIPYFNKMGVRYYKGKIQLAQPSTNVNIISYDYYFFCCPSMSCL